MKCPKCNGWTTQLKLDKFYGEEMCVACLAMVKDDYKTAVMLAQQQLKMWRDMHRSLKGKCCGL